MAINIFYNIMILTGNTKLTVFLLKTDIWSTFLEFKVMNIGAIIIKQGNPHKWVRFPPTPVFIHNFIFPPIWWIKDGGNSNIKIRKLCSKLNKHYKPPVFTPFVDLNQLQGRLKMLNPWSWLMIFVQRSWVYTFLLFFPSQPH